MVQISGRFRSNPGVSTFKWALRMGRPPSLNLTGSHTNIGRGRYISFKNPNGDVVVVGLNANDTPRCGNVSAKDVFLAPFCTKNRTFSQDRLGTSIQTCLKKRGFFFKRFCSHLELSVDGKVVGSPVLPPHSMNTFVVMAHA